tara:strand:- start:1383 stop:1673 length:291 start_codon:yes stop_codon:yes gene_type:complete
MAGELNVILTLVSAVIMAALGYLKNSSEESFDPSKLFTTFVAAFIIGGLYAGANVPTVVGEELFEYFLIRSGAVVFLERIFKALWRKWIGPWYDAL